MTALPALAIPPILDLDADAITNLVTGDPVTIVPDRVNGRHATQTTTANKPVYTAVNPDFKGHASFRTVAAAVSHVTMTAALTAAETVNRRTLVFIGKLADTGDGTFIDGATSTHKTAMLLSSGSPTTMSASASGGRLDFGARITTPQIAIATYGVSLSTLGKQNGGAKSTKAMDSTTHEFDRLRLGCTDSLTSAKTVDFARVIVFAGLISDSDIVILDTWAQDTYGIAVADYAGTAVGPTAPTVPGAFLAPRLGSVVDKTALVEHGGSTDANGDAVVYDFDLTVNGGTTWVNKRSGITTASFEYDYSLEVATTTAQWRSVARDASLSSAARLSDTFTIAHVGTVPAAQALPALSIPVLADYDPRRLTGLADGAAVSTLLDVNERPATQATVASRPTFVASSAAFAGQPAINFAAGQFLSVLSQVPLPVFDRTVVLVFKPASTADATFLDGEVFDRTTKIEHPASLPGRIAWWARDSRVDLGARTVDAQVVVATFNRGPVIGTQNGLAANGVMRSNIDPYDRLRIGATDTLDQYGPMLLARLVVLRGVATRADLNAINEWASTLYGIPVAAALAATPPEKFTRLKDGPSLWELYGTAVFNSLTRLAVTVTPSFAGAVSIDNYDLVGSAAGFEYIVLPNSPAAGETGVPSMMLKLSRGTADNALEVGWRNGSLIMRTVVAGVVSEANIAYDLVTMARMRIREEVGTVVWETAPAGTENWTLRRSVAAPFPLDDLRATRDAGYTGTMASPGVAVFASLGVPPPPGVRVTFVDLGGVRRRGILKIVPGA